MRLGLMIKTNQLFLWITLWHISLLSFWNHNMKLPNVKFYGQKFSLFSLKLDAVSDNLIKVKFAYIILTIKSAVQRLCDKV